MGQFKPMVKMMTTEPSVELKLKKGGPVKMQMGGMPPADAAMPAAGAARTGAPIGGMGQPMATPGLAPKRPSMAARRRAMMARPSGAAPAAPVGMAGRMMKEGGETKATHKAEMKAIKGLKSEMASHKDKPASKAHKGLKTGGVVDGQGGYAHGGIIKSTKGETKVVTAKPDHSPAKTGDVKMGNAGGYATGGVAKANAGGYKKGGSAKKAYATGGLVDTGRPVAMPQGAKKPSTPVSINQLSGTFKKGGRVTPAEGRLHSNFKKENATAMKQAKAYSNEVYSKYGKKMAGGGYADSEDAQMKSNREGYEAWEKSQGEENKATKKMVEDALMFVPRKLKKLFSGKPAPGAVTETKESVTVSPPQKKRGGAVTC
jgi:hypothetical protein